MKVWLITVGEPIPMDQKNVRLLRTGIFAESLSKNKHDVIWWNSTFNHSKREQRFSANTDIQHRDNLQIKLLYGCGYKSSMSFRRIWDHILVAFQFYKLSKKMPKPDVILCSLPTLELSQAAVAYGKKNNVPVILDIRDLWPDLFLDYVPNKLKPILNLFLAPMWWQARYACSGATAITGCAPALVDWGVNLSGRKTSQYDKYFPFGYAANKATEQQISIAYEKWERLGIKKSDDNFMVCFFGTLGSQFDIETIINAARALKSKNVSLTFVICGDGDELKRYRGLAADLDNVIFPGWIDSSDIWTLMQISDVGIAPYYNNAGFSGSIPNKPIEYLSAGLPVVSSLCGFFEEFLREQSCGVSYKVGDINSLVEALILLSRDKNTRDQMSKNALSVFREKFMAEKVYGDMTNYLEEVAALK